MFRLRPRQVRRRVRYLAAALAAVFSANAALAAPFTWSGDASVNQLWSNGLNWAGTAPTSATTTDLVFGGTTNTGTLANPLNNDITAQFVLNSITFNASTSSFFLGGLSLQFNGAANTITQNSSSAENIANTIDPTGKTGNTTTTITLTGDGTGVVTMSMIVSGNGLRDYAITKTGTSTFVLSGNNTYGGATTVSAGILNIQNNNGLGGTGGGTSVASGATLQLQGVTIGAETLQINGTGAAGQNGALVSVSGTNNYGGLITLGSNSTISSDDGGTLNLTNTGTITGSGFGLTLTGTGNGSVASVIGTGVTGSLTKNGTGTWTLNGANTYGGTTTVNSGTLRLGVASALGGTSGVTVNNSGSLALGASNTINNAATMTLNGNVISNNPATKNLVVTNSEGSSTPTTATAGLGSLTLLSRSTLDFLGSTSTIVFGQTLGTAFVDAGSFKLDIYNYTGDSTPAGNLDHLVFQQDMTAFTTAGDFEFWNGSAFVAATATQLDSSGFWEITPVTAIPEPSTWLAAALALGAIGLSQRKRLRGMLKTM